MSALIIFVGLLFVLSALACLAGWVWLLVRGFKTSAGWGIAMFFVAPIASIVAAVKDWQHWKRPLLFYWGGFAAQVAVGIFAAIAVPAMFMANGGGKEFAAAMEEAQKQAQAEAAQGQVHDDQEADVEPEPGGEVAQVDRDDAGETIRMERQAQASSDAAASESESHHLTDPSGARASASVTDRSIRLPNARATSDEGVEVPPGYEVVSVASAANRTGARCRIIDLDGRIHAGVLTGVENGALQVRFDLGAGSVVTGFEPKEIKSLQVAQMEKAN